MFRFGLKHSTMFQSLPTCNSVTNICADECCSFHLHFNIWVFTIYEAGDQKVCCVSSWMPLCEIQIWPQLPPSPILFGHSSARLVSNIRTILQFFTLQITSRSNNVEGTLADVWQDVKICQSPSVSTCNSAANIYMRHCITRLATQHNGHIHNDAETI